MTPAQLWNNIVAYALQVGLLVALGAIIPPVLKLRTPRARLLFWQAILASCVLLPWIQPSGQQVINVSSVKAIAPAILLGLLAAGVIVRIALLILGLVRLAGYRRRSHELTSDPVFRIATPTTARWLVSEEISSPVTFGWRDPVVLLPARFPSLRPELREVILCHELIHIERRDWMFTVAEELARAIFWFHPAIWWVLGEIQLAREQTVDQAVLEITHAREHYIDALLTMATSASPAANQLDLAPAPLFLRRRHLKRRVVDAAGSAKLLYRTPVLYPAEAIRRIRELCAGVSRMPAQPRAGGVSTFGIALGLTRFVSGHGFSRCAPAFQRVPSSAARRFNANTLILDRANVDGACVQTVAPETAFGKPLKAVRIDGPSDSTSQLLPRLTVQAGVGESGPARNTATMNGVPVAVPAQIDFTLRVL